MGKARIIVLLFLLIFAVILTSPLLLSRLLPNGTMLINGSGDNLWHLSLAVETTKQIPPTFPLMSGIPLKNYHYFSDALWGTISLLSGIPIAITYFQIGSLSVTFLLVFLIFKLAQKFSLNDFWSVICVITTLFFGSAAFIKPLFIKGSDWSGNAFILDQPYDQLINLHTGIGYILIILGTYLVLQWISSKSIKYGYLAAITLSLLFGVKIFFALPMVVAFGVVCLLQIEKNKYKNIFPAILLIILSGIIFFSISDKTGFSHNAPLTFRPGWLLTKMVEDPERFSLNGFYLKYLHYQSKNNWPRLAQMEMEKIFIYILGNFWIKLLGLIYLIKSFKRSFKENIFLGLCILVSLSLPLVITPQPDPFNAVQFGQVAVIFLGFLLGVFLAKNKYGLLLLFVLSPLVIYSLGHDFFNSGKFHEYVIPKEEIMALDYLKINSGKDAIVMVDPIFDNKKTKVSALAERRTFFTGGIIPWLLGIDGTKRESVQESFFLSGTDVISIENIISEYGIKYIYASSSANFEKFGYPLIYSNTLVSIYKSEKSSSGLE